MDSKPCVEEKFMTLKTIHPTRRFTTFNRQYIKKCCVINKRLPHNCKNLSSFSLCSRKEKGEHIKPQIAKLRKKLKNSNLELRQKWSEELVLKLILIEKCFKDKLVIITLESIFIDDKSNLFIDLEKLKFDSKDDLNIYLTPENINRVVTNSIHQTMWSAGICLYFINALNFPWLKASIEDKNYLSWLQKEKFPDKFNSFVKRTLKILLRTNPIKNKTTRQLGPNVFVDELNTKIVS